MNRSAVVKHLRRTFHPPVGRSEAARGLRSESAHESEKKDDANLRALQFCFALLTVMGGFALAMGDGDSVVPVVAVLFAVIGYLFVDVGKWIALPPTAAYIAMAIAAIVCISDFADRSTAGPRQLMAVAQLLVLVQAILMMQRKTQRIFEQLAIFSLLELIVAAVFNHTASFALLLLPMIVVGAVALSLLASRHAFAEHTHDDADKELRMLDCSVTTMTSSSPSLASRRASRSAINSMLMLAAPITLIAGVFFYALPRTSKADRARPRGEALVGFSEQVRLEQLGQMLQNPAIAVRCRLTDRANGLPYRSNDGLYLRGRVLERYRTEVAGKRTIAIWDSVPISTNDQRLQLPAEYTPQRMTDTNFYDPVQVAIECESMNSKSLFAIAPYHRLDRNSAVTHIDGTWTLRWSESRDWIRPRIDYRFGTHAFSGGEQSSWIHARAPSADYRQELLEFDPAMMPTTAALARQITKSIGNSPGSSYEMAKAIESHFMLSDRYRYSLDLRSASLPGTDSIEQFVAIDRVGHCQYFASAMAMMLRSLNIPARLVVGYRTNQYNDWADEYIARQSHAHAWVEALIEAKQTSRPGEVYGQPESDYYWLRLDPTPASDQLGGDAGIFRQSIDLAQDLWEDNVLQVDVDSQNESLLSSGIQPSGPWYDQASDWLTRQIQRFQAGDLGGGSLSDQRIFSWPIALAAVVFCFAVFLLSRIRRIGGRSERDHRLNRTTDRPTVDFYAAALDQLARLGICRQPGQTPQEFAIFASEQLNSQGAASLKDSLQRLTFHFYRRRFGPERESAAEDATDLIASDLASLSATVESILARTDETDASQLTH